MADKNITNNKYITKREAIISLEKKFPDKVSIIRNKINKCCEPFTLKELISLISMLSDDN